MAAQASFFTLPASFLPLQRKWYAILASEGFKDAEHKPLQYSTPYLYQNSERYKRKFHYGIFQYYQFCRDFTHAYSFKDKKDATIWALYTEGMTGNIIASTTNFYCPATIYSKIARLEVEMFKLIKNGTLLAEYDEE